MTPNKLEQKSVNTLLPLLTSEYDAFYHYRALSNWCANVGYFKAAEFFAKESEDELEHAKKIEKYLVDWNVTPMLPAVIEPRLTYDNLLEGIESAYKMEYQLYEQYEKAAEKIFSEDICTFGLIQEFLKVQLSAVAEYSDKLNVLEGVEPTKFNLLLLEKKIF
jgi:ferritin